ncbi:hypothetical protein ACNOYE_32935 [Nannocystaceae bacterium ST9]
MLVVMRDPRRIGVLALLGLAACGSEAAERSREVVDDKIDQARDRLADAGAELERTGREGLRQASEGLDHWLEQGREQLDGDDEYKPIAGAAEAIHCESDTRCTIDAAFIDRLAADPLVLSGEAVALPTQAESDKGLALSGVRTGSIPALLGLVEGDVLISLNGTNLASLAAPRALADALAGTDEATLIFERSGSRRTLTIVRTKKSK